VGAQLGIRPLGTLCLYYPPEKDAEQERFLDYLFEEGADINHIDKVGLLATISCPTVQGIKLARV
jgi:hypothetical protein